MEPPRMEQPWFEQPRMEPPRFEQPRMEPPRFEQPRMEPPCFEQPRMDQPWFEQPRMEPPRFEPRMEPPWIGQPQFGFPRAEPFQPRIGQPEVGFRVEPPQRFGPIRDEPYREQAKLLLGMPRYRQILSVLGKKLRKNSSPTLPEVGYVKIAIDGLNFELRKKFEGITFIDLFELSERAFRFEGLLKEENQRKNSSYGTYYQDPNYEIDLAEYIVQDKIDRNVLKFPEIPQESMAVDADPFPFVDVNTTSVDLSSLMPHKNLHIKNNKSKVNLLQAFGPQERQLVQEMSNLKIERSATTGQSSSAKVSGRSLSIKDNNVHADKRKNVACPIGQPIISYKEMLRKEPLKVSSESDKDDTICERCSHILAKCFSRTKKEDNYKPQKAEEPRHDSQHEQPKMTRSRQIFSMNSQNGSIRLGSQYEQPRVARSRLGSQYEQPRVARSRLGSQYEQPRVARSRLGPQYEQTKMVQSKPNPHHTLDSRFKSIRKPRMMRPPVSKTGRWVTLETSGLKPIHKQEYKYGYNPYFSRMTRTQRRRWIRQQAALHQESKKHLNISEDLMLEKEDITGATTKNIATPRINGTSHKLQNTETKPCQSKDSTKTQDSHKRLEKNSENAESETEYEEAKTSRILVGPQKSQVVQVWFGRKKRSPRGRKEAEDNLIEAEQSQETPIRSVQSSSIKDAEDIKSIEDSEGIKDIEDVENIGDIEDMEDIENIEDVGDIEDMEDIENIEEIDTFENSEGIDDIREIESQKPKNGKTLSCNVITLPKEFMATTWVQREEDARGAVPILLAEDEECQDTELPGLSRKLVEHRLPIKEGFQPFQQAPRRMAPDITLKIKEEIERLVRAGFIRPVRNINMATPKDEYPIPVADLLVDGASGYKVLSFMDGHSGYNQIFIAESDVLKTAFRCPRSIGTMLGLHIKEL
uniref:Reverse transcriptase domain-containing protein n=1 Tax=Fagus sylvatica TaxID=28930 RepID=A0A2N9GH53_FAGSY